MGIYRSLLVIAVTVGTLSVAESAVYAGAFGLDEQGAAAMGRANAFAAQADDPTALFYNPAGIGQLSGTQFSLGTTLITPATTFDNTNSGASTDTSAALFYPPTLYIVKDMRQDLHIGLGIFTPFGLSTEWPSDWEGRYVTTFSEINTYYLNPNIAWSPSEGFHLAAGLSYVPSSVTLSSKLDLAPAPDGDLEIEGDGDGWGYNVAALAELPANTSLGISFRSAVEIKYSGDATFSPSALGLTEPIDSSLTLPPILTVGVANRSFDALTLEADVQWVGWSQTTATIDFASLPDATPIDDWEDSYSLRLGGEHERGPVSLRVGYAYDMTPIPPDKIDPSLPDSDKHTFAVGGGYNVGNATFDLAYMFITSRDRGVDNSAGGTSFTHRGKYSTRVHEAGLGITYRF